ncbi:hypothetical protein RvY_01813-1 [Ramazzottius varieornatus]|uniref:Uncharacterized protein n=1 Tax=Ramazzottius varieornatus TaxID=947166 RepID=A0A1D1UL34_RAMVA|nr:hypothetical protein RvY_01813-1 [Ramazzottius varieornatus]
MYNNQGPQYDRNNYNQYSQDSHGRNSHSAQYSGQDYSRDGNHHYSQFNRNDGRNNSSDYSRNPGGYDPRLDRQSHSRHHEFNSSDRYGATHGPNRDHEYNRGGYENNRGYNDSNNGRNTYGDRGNYGQNIDNRLDNMNQQFRNMDVNGRDRDYGQRTGGAQFYDYVNGAPADRQHQHYQQGGRDVTYDSAHAQGRNYEATVLTHFRL